MRDATDIDGLTIQGIVVPTDWDFTGSVTKVAILTRGEGEYEVAPGDGQKRLMEHLQREVLVQAVLMSKTEEKRCVKVGSFALLDWNDPTDSVSTTLELGDG